MESLDVSSETVGLALELLQTVVLGLNDVMQQGHLALYRIDTFAEAFILLG